MMKFSNVFNSSGGLFYHYSAFKYRNTIWKSYIQQVDLWLRTWNQQREHLIIIGPSGGYSLPDSFLTQFKSVTLLDPDPLAPLSFKLTHKTPVAWLQENWLNDGLEGLQKEILSRKTTHSFLFCNILGQLPYIMPSSKKVGSYNLKDFFTSISQCSWASYHDLFSFKATLREALPNLNPWALAISKEDFDYLQQTLQHFKRPTAITDHLTSGMIGQESPRQLFLWQRLNNYYHIIEAKHHNC